MNPMQKNLHIIELFPCILNILPFIFLFPMNFLISSVTFQHQNYKNKQFHIYLQNKAIQCVPKSAYSPRFIT